MTTTAAPAATRTRLHYLDNLRIVLTAMVVLHHVALTYGDIPVWFYTEPAKDSSGLVLDVLAGVDQTFFMGLFFLISGYFTPGSYDRKGRRPFLRGRLVRLGIPLLAFLLLLRPLVTIGGYVHARAERPGLPYPLYYITSWDPGPMWFAEVLLVFAVGYVLLRRLRPLAAVRSYVPGPRAVIGFTVALGVVTYAWRLAVPTTAYWPVVGLPSPAFLPQYVSMFVIGTLAFRRGWLDALTVRAGRLGLAAAGGGLLGYLAAIGASAVLGEIAALLTAVFECVFAVGVIIALLVWFRTRFNRQSLRARFLSDHAFTVYVIHPLVLVAVGSALRPIQLIAIGKFALLAVLALPLCWALAYLVRSLPGAKRVL